MNKKLQLYIANLALKNLPFGGTKWHSSAKKLSDALVARGIEMPYKLYYEYNLPGNSTPAGFMQKYALDYFCHNFYNDFALRILTDKTLKISEKKDIIKYVWSVRKNKNDFLAQYANQIQELNPELSHINANNYRSIVYGAMFGFAPAEIDYFSNPKRRNFAREKSNAETINSFGVQLNYVLAPRTAKIVIALLRKNAQNNIKVK